MNFEEKTKKENLIFDGKVLHVYCDDIIQPDGKEAKREYKVAFSGFDITFSVCDEIISVNNVKKL
jgi:hypothetical protein